MYNIEHDCTYHKHKTNDEEELELYQNDLLIVLNESEYNTSVMNKISNLYEKIKDIEDFKKLFQEIHKNLEKTIAMFVTTSDADYECSLIMLFSYEYFHMFHEVIRRFLKDEDYEKELQLIYKYIENNKN